jgi:hippurate hydrolase
MLPFNAADRELLTALRRDLHRRPELAWKEAATQRRLITALRAIGLTDIHEVAGTGIVARVPGSGGGTTVAIRGDMDALPIGEKTGLPFASEIPGVMHACGHDVHASWAVGAALALIRSPAAGDVVILLQPAEEVGEGARAMIDAGALDGAGAIFGAHVDRRFAVGQVVAQAGALAASTDTFRIALRGPGGHGARPHLTPDPVVAASELVLALQTIVSRRLDPAEAGVVTVGMIRGGEAVNAIPPQVELAGTIRALTPSTRDLLRLEVSRIVSAVAATHRLSAAIDVSGGTPPLINDARAATWAANAARVALGAEAVVPFGITNMAGEDFSYYLERIPGCFLRIGAREPGGEPRDVHSPSFAPDEEALFVGAAVLAEAARTASAALRS